MWKFSFFRKFKPCFTYEVPSAGVCKTSFYLFLLICPVNMDYQGTCKYFFPILLFLTNCRFNSGSQNSRPCWISFGKEIPYETAPYPRKNVACSRMQWRDSRIISVKRNLFLDFTQLFLRNVIPATYLFAQFFWNT